MQIRIRHLYRAAPETVQRATHAFAAPIENMGTEHVAISDSAPVGAHKWRARERGFALGCESQGGLQKSGCSRYGKPILQEPDLQGKNRAKMQIVAK